MGDWNKFWELVNEAIPDDVILQDSNVFGDYLDGQYVVQLANQICLECGLSWYIDWDTVRVNYTTNDPTMFIKEMTGDLVVMSDAQLERRPACGLGTASNRDGVVNAKQIDTACKGALTDLVKNGWMRFGRRLGGQLYFGKNPHIARALGWEVSERQRRPQATQAVEPSEDLDSYTIHPGGWGKDNKFGGMTLAEVYENPDGYGAMSWAATLDVPRGATAKMAQYFNRREQEEEGPDMLALEEMGVSLEEYDKSVAKAAIPASVPGETMVQIAGRNVVANELLTPGWTNYVQQLIVKYTGPDMVFGHSNHVVNHLKSHFNVAKVMDLTGEKAAALVSYIESGGKDADPRWYAEIPVPSVVEPATIPSGEAIAQLFTKEDIAAGKAAVEEMFGPESVEDLLKKAAPNLPEAWRWRPERWWAGLCKQYDIGILNAKQLETVRALLDAVASGNMSLEDTGSATYRIFVNGMKQVAEDG